jgi:hypothetical protein
MIQVGRRLITRRESLFLIVTGSVPRRQFVFSTFDVRACKVLFGSFINHRRAPRDSLTSMIKSFAFEKLVKVSETI